MTKRTNRGAVPPTQLALLVGTQIRTVRLARGLSQASLAAPEFTRSYISAVEQGKVCPSLPALDMLARRLDVALTDLLPPTARGSDLAGVGAHLDEAAHWLYYGDFVGVWAALDAAYALIRLPVPPALHARLAYTTGLAWLGWGAPQRARTAFQKVLTLLPAASVTRLAVEDALGETYFAQHALQRATDYHTACQQTLQRQCEVPAAVTLSIHAHLARDLADLRRDAAVVALIESIQPQLPQLTNLDLLVAGWPTSMIPDDGLVTPVAPDAALYAAITIRRQAAWLLVLGAGAAHRQGAPSQAIAWCQQAQEYLTGAEDIVLCSEVETCQAQCAGAAQRLVEAETLVTTALTRLEKRIRQWHSRRLQTGTLTPTHVSGSQPQRMVRAYIYALATAGQVALWLAYPEQATQRFQAARAWARLNTPHLVQTLAAQYPGLG